MDRQCSLSLACPHLVSTCNPGQGKKQQSSGKESVVLSYGKIKRKDIDSPDGLLPASFDGYNIIEDGDIVLR